MEIREHRKSRANAEIRSGSRADFSNIHLLFRLLPVRRNKPVVGLQQHAYSLLQDRSFLMSRQDMDCFITFLTKNYSTYGPLQKNRQTVFGQINNPGDILWEYEQTILSPKKYLHQPMETLFSFKDGGSVLNDVRDGQKQVLFGLHPCDIHGIHILDRVFSGKYADPYYLERRQNTILVALGCMNAYETCWCTSFGTGPNLTEGFDIMVSPLGQTFLVEVGSERGEKLLEQYGGPEKADPSLLAEYARLKAAKLETIENQIIKRTSTDGMGQLLEVSVNHPVWNKLDDECLACGSCTIVCPTCFCFNVIDKVDLTLRSGERQRVWDSCMLLEFAEVALGVNFRNERAARIKQRIYHKLYSFPYQYDVMGCVGCGRCTRFCIKKIDPREIISEMRDARDEV